MISENKKSKKLPNSMPKGAARRFNFTKKKIDLLESVDDKKQNYYADTQVRGLYISVARGGTKTFILRKKIEGRSERITLGVYPDISLDEARKLAYEARTKIANGVNPAETKRKAKEELTLEDLFLEYLERHADKQRKTGGDMRKNFERYLGHWKERQAKSHARRLSAFMETSRGKREYTQQTGPYSC